MLNVQGIHFVDLVECRQYNRASLIDLTCVYMAWRRHTCMGLKQTSPYTR
jgi:hypothetical protein